MTQEKSTISADEIYNRLVGRTFIPDRKQEVRYFFGENILTIERHGFVERELEYFVGLLGERVCLITKHKLNPEPLIISVMATNPVLIQLIDPIHLNVFALLLEVPN